jgi:hypothetical protein
MADKAHYDFLRSQVVKFLKNEGETDETIARILPSPNDPAHITTREEQAMLSLFTFCTNRKEERDRAKAAPGFYAGPKAGGSYLPFPSTVQAVPPVPAPTTVRIIPPADLAVPPQALVAAPLAPQDPVAPMAAAPQAANVGLLQPLLDLVARLNSGEVFVRSRSRRARESDFAAGVASDVVVASGGAGGDVVVASGGAGGDVVIVPDDAPAPRGLVIVGIPVADMPSDAVLIDSEDALLAFSREPDNFFTLVNSANVGVAYYTYVNKRARLG